MVRYDCSGDEESDEAEEEEEEEQAGLPGLNPRGVVAKSCAPWRRRPSRLKRPHVRAVRPQCRAAILCLFPFYPVWDVLIVRLKVSLSLSRFLFLSLSLSVAR